MFPSSGNQPAAREWASIADAATALGVHRDTVRRMIARGELRAARIGPRLVRVDLSSIAPVPLGPEEAKGQEAAAPVDGRSIVGGAA